METGSVGSRLNCVLDYHKMSTYSLERQLGFSKNSLCNTVLEKNSPSYESLVKVLSHFPEVNGDWLLTGRGQMLLPKNFDPNTSGFKYNGTFLIGAKASAGPSSFLQETFEQVPVCLPRLSGDGYLLIEVEGTSMWPTLVAGDLIIIREVKSFEELASGKVCVFCNGSDIHVKRLFPSKLSGGKQIIAQSDNPIYSEFEVEMNEQLRVWEVVSVLSEHLVDIRMPDNPILSEIARRLEKIESSPKG